jgi:ankyrin repeat protein
MKKLETTRPNETDLNQALCAAVARGYRWAVSALLKAGARPLLDCEGWHANAALVWASGHNPSLEVLDMLMPAGGNRMINGRDHARMPILQLLLLSGHHHLVVPLVERGADPNAELGGSWEGDSILTHVCSLYVMQLIALGANWDADSMQAILYTAAFTGYYDVCHNLLDLAERRLVPAEGKTPSGGIPGLSLAEVLVGGARCVFELEKLDEPLERVHPDDFYLFAWRLVHEYGTEIDAVIVHRDDPSFIESVLMYCAAASNPGVLRAVLELGADPNQPIGNLDRTPLHIVCEGNDFREWISHECVEILLEFGADIGARDCRNDLPVHVALRNNKNLLGLETLRVLCPTRQIADVTNTSGMSALSRAMVNHAVPSSHVEYLLSLGCRPDLRTMVMYDDRPIPSIHAPIHCFFSESCESKGDARIADRYRAFLAAVRACPDGLDFLTGDGYTLLDVALGGRFWNSRVIVSILLLEGADPFSTCVQPRGLVDLLLRAREEQRMKLMLSVSSRGGLFDQRLYDPAIWRIVGRYAASRVIGPRAISLRENVPRGVYE